LSAGAEDVVGAHRRERVELVCQDCAERVVTHRVRDRCAQAAIAAIERYQHASQRSAIAHNHSPAYLRRCCGWCAGGFISPYGGRVAARSAEYIEGDASDSLSCSN